MRMIQIKAEHGLMAELSKKLRDTLGRRPRGDEPPPGDGKNGANRRWLVVLLVAVAVLLLWQSRPLVGVNEIPYSEFQELVDRGRVDQAIVTERYITGTLKPAEDKAEEEAQRFVTIPLWNQDVANALAQHGVKYTVRPAGTWLSNFLVNWLLPLALLFAFWSWLGRRMMGRAGGLLSMGSRARIHPESAPKVTFGDVAGVDDAKQELREVIEFLEDPTRIQKLGGRMPKGVLLVGPPGTGKTLLARAVAGEAGVPFFNIGGSEFIELFVGVGAARVRDLFEQARQKAPCIIFIDELDAIGRSRGGPNVMGGHDEREQTLNQLLTEMDGFDPTSGVVVMAATNRPEILDKALLRAGRFDRQIVVDKPGMEDRVAILQIHTGTLKLADDVDLRVVAQRTPGFVGADLANVCNEAAIIAVRNDHTSVDMQDFEAAIDRVVTGPEKRSRALSTTEKRRVAYHEAGHALVAEIVPTGEPVHKVSIIPRGVAALGFTLQLPVEEKFLSTEAELHDQIAILMGGRVAEELVFTDVSSGAQNDLEKASDIARAMVCRLGMSRHLGPLVYGKTQRLMYLDVVGPEERNYSEETARAIDTEVRSLIEDGHRRAREILTGHHDILDAIANLLIEREVVSGDEIKKLVEPNL